MKETKSENQMEEEDYVEKVWGIEGRMKRRKAGEGGGGTEKKIAENKHRKRKRRREDHNRDKDLLVSSH